MAHSPSVLASPIPQWDPSAAGVRGMGHATRPLELSLKKILEGAEKRDILGMRHIFLDRGVETCQ